MKRSRSILIAGGVAVVAALAAIGGRLMYDGGAWQSSAESGPDRGAALAALAEETGMTVHDTPRPVADLAFADAGGNELSLADFEGSTVVLNLWATWCAPCLKEMPDLDALEAALGGPAFTVIALSQDRGGLNQVEPFWDKAGLEHLAIYLDEQMAAGQAVEARGLPTTLLIDPEGREIGRVEGPAKWDAPAVIDALAAVAGAS